jgi:NADH-quinone oxidoreductase subunit F
VNNVETVACVKHIVQRGVDWFRALGVPADPLDRSDPGSYGPKLYCVSGHVQRPGCYEGPLGLTCRWVIDRLAGGVWKGRRHAVVPGRLSTGLLTAEESTRRWISAGRSAPDASVRHRRLVFDKPYPIIDFLHNSYRFFHTSCGQYAVKNALGR